MIWLDLVQSRRCIIPNGTSLFWLSFNVFICTECLLHLLFTRKKHTDAAIRTLGLKSNDICTHIHHLQIETQRPDLSSIFGCGCRYIRFLCFPTHSLLTVLLAPTLRHTEASHTAHVGPPGTWSSLTEDCSFRYSAEEAALRDCCQRTEAPSEDVCLDEVSPVRS